MALLHATALEAMRLYGTDITQRMYLVESAIAHPQEVAFCATVPPGSTGEYVETLPATPALSLYHHGAYEDLPAAEKKLRAYARRHGLTPTGKLLVRTAFSSRNFSPVRVTPWAVPLLQKTDR